MSTQLPFVLPFIRWADVVDIPSGQGSPSQRRLYDHEFVYVMGGNGHIVINGVAHRALPDRLFLVQPRVWHAYLADCETNLILLGVHFDWTPRHDTLKFPIFRAVEANSAVDESLFRTPREAPNWSLLSNPFLDLKGRLSVRRALENVVSEYAREDNESRAAAGALLAHAIFLMSREVQQLQQVAQGAAIGPDALRRIENARKWLESPENWAMSIEDVAAQVGWSGDHLRRAFRRVLKTSPAKIQMAARIRLARELLRRGELSVGNVALQCGFEDASHFTKAFTRESGLSPRQFLALNKRA